MKYITTVFILFLTQFIYAQDIVGKHWYINAIIGGDMQNTQAFTLSKVVLNTKNQFLYGNSIIFNDNNTFSCSYSAPCGNDCFPSSTGTFKMIDDKHIQLFVIEYDQQGDCESKHIELNKDLGIYYILNESDEIIKLVKGK